MLIAASLPGGRPLTVRGRGDLVVTWTTPVPPRLEDCPPGGGDRAGDQVQPEQEVGSEHKVPGRRQPGRRMPEYCDDRFGKQDGELDTQRQVLQGLAQVDRGST